jgi:hypothetical protein
MRRGPALLICAAIGLASCGVGETRTVTQTVTGTAAQASPEPADPTLDAQCVQEPNGQAPQCTQGTVAVSVTIGAPCQDPAYQQPEAWQWTYSGSSTVRCMTVLSPSGG